LQRLRAKDFSAVSYGKVYPTLVLAYWLSVKVIAGKIDQDTLEWIFSEQSQYFIIEIFFSVIKSELTFFFNLTREGR